MDWIFGKSQYFSPDGDPGFNDPDGTKMKWALITTLDQMRGDIGIPFIITSGYRTPDAQDALVAAGVGDRQTNFSAHPTGEGADGYFRGIPLIAQFLHACRYGFRGVGIYPWTSLGHGIIHVDVLNNPQRPGWRKSMWVRDDAGVYHYAPGPNFNNLLRAAGEILWQSP